MKRIILQIQIWLFFAIALIIDIELNGQTIERGIISPFGQNHTNAAFQLDATLGETIIFSGESSSNKITQGFHQPIAIVALCQIPQEETINASACLTYELNGETFTASGTYTQMLTAENGCDSIIYLHLQLNALSNEVIIEENMLTAVQENASYSWSLCGDQTVLSTSQTFTPEQSGDYQVSITQEDCEVTSGCVSYVVGVDEIKNRIELNIFPNPVRDILQLEIKGNNENPVLAIYDGIGNLVSQEPLSNSKTKISVEHLAAGPYMLVLHFGEYISSKPFVKQ